METLSDHLMDRQGRSCRRWCVQESFLQCAAEKKHSPARSETLAAKCLSGLRGPDLTEPYGK